MENKEQHGSWLEAMGVAFIAGISILLLYTISLWMYTVYTSYSALKGRIIICSASMHTCLDKSDDVKNYDKYQTLQFNWRD